MQPSASKSYLLTNCAYSFDPLLELPTQDDPGEPARYGSAFHELMAVILQDPAYDLTLVYETLVKWSLPASLADELRTHVTQAYAVLSKWLGGDNPWSHAFTVQDVEASKWLAFWEAGYEIGNCTLDENGHVYAGVPDHAIAGTVDLTALGDGQLVVLDHKTGLGDYSQPASNPQLLTLAAMTGATIAAVLHAPRQGLPHVYAEDIDATVLQAHLVKLQHALERVGDGSMRPGAWCQYCPARTVCPAKQGEIINAAVRSAEAFGLALPKRETGIVTPDKLGKLHLMMSQGQKLLDAAAKEIKAYVRDNPGELVIRPDGKILQLVPVEQERLSKAAVVRALGAVDAEVVFADLRKRGALTTETVEFMKAVPNETA